MENGIMPLIGLHLERMNRSRRELWGYRDPIVLPDLRPPDSELLNKKWKIRILYKNVIEKTEWILYQQAAPKKVLVLDPGKITYPYKYADRRFFDQLKIQNPGYDDFIILQSEWITDASYCNVVLRLGDTWVTPKSPLLKGVRRESLIREGIIAEKKLNRKHLAEATEIKFINAMIPFEQAIVIQKDQLFYQ